MNNLEYYLIFFILPFVLTLWAQVSVKNAYSKYSKIRIGSGMTGYDTARRILDKNGLYNVAIERISGQMTDHYDPRANVIRLSDGVYSSPSIAACGIAAHEAGHVIQYATDYGPIKLRMSVIKVANIGSQLAMPLFILGIILSNPLFCELGIIAYSAALVFQVVTLPVEFNASRKAKECIESFGASKSENAGVSKVLNAAAMTYVASLAVSLLSLMRLILISNRSRRN